MNFQYNPLEAADLIESLGPPLVEKLQVGQEWVAISCCLLFWQEIPHSTFDADKPTDSMAT